MRRDTVFSDPVHLPGAYLDLERRAVFGKQSGVQGLIAVGFGHRYVVLEASRDRRPLGMYGAENSVTVLYGIYDDAYGSQIEDLVQLLVLVDHLFVDAVVVLFAAVYLEFYIKSLYESFDIVY